MKFWILSKRKRINGDIQSKFKIIHAVGKHRHSTDKAKAHHQLSDVGVPGISRKCSIIFPISRQNSRTESVLSHTFFFYKNTLKSERKLPVFTTVYSMHCRTRSATYEGAPSITAGIMISFGSFSAGRTNKNLFSRWSTTQDDPPLLQQTSTKRRNDNQRKREWNWKRCWISRRIEAKAFPSSLVVVSHERRKLFWLTLTREASPAKQNKQTMRIDLPENSRLASSYHCWVSRNRRKLPTNFSKRLLLSSMI